MSFSIMNAEAAPPKNIILMIGDGMGYEIIRGAGMYANGEEGTLSFESLPYHASVKTIRYDGTITGSSEAATALATGYNAGAGVVSVAIPGNKAKLKTILEIFKDAGKMTGLLTTEYLVGATPAAFGAHQEDRDMTKAIYKEFLEVSRPNVLMGGGGSGAYVYPATMNSAGYLTVADRWGLALVDPETTDRLAGIFGSNGRMQFEYGNSWSFENSYPHLSEMVEAALDILDNDPDGFFVMIEGGLIDGACHNNTWGSALAETVEFSNAVQVALNWAQGRDDTLILVTADHETGGPIVTQNNGKGVLPTMTWSSTDHTANDVGLWGIGPNAELIDGTTIDNVEVFYIMMGVMLGDLNEDGEVGVVDLSILAANYGMTSGATRPMGDLSGDRAVDVTDLSILSANYGRTLTGNTGSSEEAAQAWESIRASAKETGDETSSEESADSSCGALGLSLIACLAMMGLMTAKFD
jgi:alkaline phosphatase